MPPESEGCNSWLGLLDRGVDTTRGLLSLMANNASRSLCFAPKAADAAPVQIDFKTGRAYRFIHGFGYQALYQHMEVWHGTDQSDRHWNGHL